MPGKISEWVTIVRFELLEEALKSNDVSYTLTSIKEGDKVVTFLGSQEPIPDIIVLDFNLPRVHGKEILRMLKSSPAFSDIPLIVLTTSSAKEDIEYALNLGADHFITKPTSLDGFADAVSMISAAVKRN